MFKAESWSSGTGLEGLYTSVLDSLALAGQGELQGALFLFSVFIFDLFLDKYEVKASKLDRGKT